MKNEKSERERVREYEWEVENVRKCVDGRAAKLAWVLVVPWRWGKPLIPDNDTIITPSI